MMFDLPSILGDWGGFFGAANDAVQTVAIVVGGGWAYRKYIHSKASYASLVLDVDAKVEQVDDRRCMRLATKITNSGTYQMDFDVECEQRLAIRCLDRETWTKECVDPQIRWASAHRVGFDQLVDTNGIREIDTSLEPSESIGHSWLVPLPDGDWVAYRVVFKVSACRRAWGRKGDPFEWTTTRIVVAG